ncbi:MAG: bifunctional DNA primase/polymerase [Deltaproteobacteria bacterium]|jgi:hypothetical protein|nr:bifunctional DNA primase/polymerase [Deltaproteobacteria bacterium]
MTKTTINQIYEASREYVSEGVSVVPVKGKRPEFNWTEYRGRLPTEEELASWFNVANPPNIALVNGYISGVWSVDCDDAKTIDWLMSLIQGPLETVGIAETLRGQHFFFRLSEDDAYNVGKRFIPRAKGLNLDIRCSGSLTVLPPSVHPEGHVYKWLNKLPFNEMAEASPWVVLDQLKDAILKLLNNQAATYGES